jgi:hypothetical protein
VDPHSVWAGPDPGLASSTFGAFNKCATSRQTKLPCADAHGYSHALTESGRISMRLNGQGARRDGLMICLERWALIMFSYSEWDLSMFYQVSHASLVETHNQAWSYPPCSYCAVSTSETSKHARFIPEFHISFIQNLLKDVLVSFIIFSFHPSCLFDFIRSTVSSCAHTLDRCSWPSSHGGLSRYDSPHIVFLPQSPS